VREECNGMDRSLLTGVAMGMAAFFDDVAGLAQ
jgi:hypothetical protein